MASKARKISVALLAAALTAAGAMTGVTNQASADSPVTVNAATALFGAQQPLAGDEPVAYVLTACLALACFATYFVVRSTVLLVAGVVATTIVVPEVVWDVTDGAVGGGVLLLVAGAVLLATSLGSTWIRRTR